MPPPVEPDVDLVLEGKGGKEPMRVVVRSLRTQDDYRQCVLLERETWGQEYAVPASLLMVNQKVGGVSAGAFDADGRMVGMVFGLAGSRGGRRVHWSHMLAVRKPMRGLGLGREIKLFQRRMVKRLGAEVMFWTYDPLVARNAHLNINRLGALPMDYLEDLYGSESDSDLHSGLGTDRFVVEWPLEDEMKVTPEDPRAWEGMPIVNTDSAGDPLDGDFDLVAAEWARIEIPLDIQQAKGAAPEAGARWRSCTRRAIEGYLATGHRVVGFSRDEGTDRCFYLLRAAGAP